MVGQIMACSHIGASGQYSSTRIKRVHRFDVILFRELVASRCFRVAVLRLSQAWFISFPFSQTNREGCG